MHILLPRCPEPNQFLRACNKQSIYFVKRKYQIALCLKFPNYPSTSKTSLIEWNMSWKFEIPEKDKGFYIESGSKFVTNS